MGNWLKRGAEAASFAEADLQGGQANVRVRRCGGGTVPCGAAPG